MHLEDLGWDRAFARAFEAWAATPHLQPGRVSIEFNHIYRVLTAHGDIDAVAAGRLKHQATKRSALPAVGDWVVVRQPPSQDRASIQAVLPRRSRFSRKVAGSVTDEQVVAANVDVVFLLMALDDDFNLRRLERYLLLGRESGAFPVVLLTKPDVCQDVASRVRDTAALSGDLPVHVVSPKHGDGLDRVSAYLPRGRTGALLGSSGVGKSTLINRLSGADTQRTQEVRAVDSRGRHTTTNRQLVRLPGGGLLIDTPGMRELQLWDVGGAMQQTFDDVTALAAHCHFSNCRHREEPRCAVKEAVAAGTLPAGRLESYQKLQDELAHLKRQQDERLQGGGTRRARIMGKSLKTRRPGKGRS